MHRQFTFASSRSRLAAPVHKKQEAKWMRQLCAGEATAWTALVELWSPRLYSYVFYNVAPEAEAQKLLTTIFAAIAKAIVGSFQISNLTILIFSIAHQHVLYYRYQNSDSTTKNNAHALASAITIDPTTAGFLDTFHHFTPELQQILLLYYLCGVSLPEISQIVGEREELLRKLLHRAQFYLLMKK